MKWATGISQLSAWARPEAHLTQQTLNGALVTVLGALLALTLAGHEVAWFLGASHSSHMAVDLQRRHDILIHADITFPAIPCAGLAIDVYDSSGTSKSDVSFAHGVHLHKQRLDERGRRLRGKGRGEYNTPQSQQVVQSDIGAVISVDLAATVRHMGEVDEEAAAHEGCRVVGSVEVPRVAGHLRFSVHRRLMIDPLMMMMMMGGVGGVGGRMGMGAEQLLNASHVIHKLAFGPEFPGQVNPLDGASRIEAPNAPLHAYKYFVKVVPTEYRSRLGMVLETNQYSVSEYALPLDSSQGPQGSAAQAAGDTHTASGATASSDPHQKEQHEQQQQQHQHQQQRPPSVEFAYDVSPLMMAIDQSPLSLLHFLVRLCAVVGGAVSVTAMLDKLVHAGATRLGKGGGVAAGDGTASRA